MVKKQIQRHDFLTGGPVLQYEIPFVDGAWDYDTWVPQDIVFDTNQIIPGITVNDNIGNNIIFQANEDTIQWMGQEVMTEERVREIVNEILGRE
jgi:hypothetical protein